MTNTFPPLRQARLAAALGVAIAAALLVGSVPAFSETPAGRTGSVTVAYTGVGAAVNDEVYRAVASARSSGDPTSVIVELAAPVAAEAAGPAERAAKQATASAVAQRVLARLPADTAAKARKLDNWPVLSVTIDSTSLDALRSSPDVARVFLNHTGRPSLAESVPLVGGDVSTAAGWTGAGWTVAILDTGVDSTHPFLAGKVVAEACYSSTVGAFEAVCPGPDPTTATGPGSAAPCPMTAQCSHGTHVAGIAAGKGTEFSGVARDADIIAVQVFSRATAGCSPDPSPCARFMEFDLMRGLDFVFGLRGTYNIAAANMSLGGVGFEGPCDYSAVKVSMDALRGAGIASVVAAGNSGNSSAIDWPACTTTAVSVGSTTKSDAVSGFSSSAASMTLWAPGSSINSSVPGGGFGYKSGTSMATPHVTGAWALLKQMKPAMSVGDGIGLLRGTGLPIVEPDSGLAFPRLRLDAAARPPTFHALTPARLADTRDGTGTGGSTAPLAAAGTLSLPVLGRGGVPSSGVSAVVLNVTGVAPTQDTYLTVFPGMFPRPFTSNVNLRAGEVRPNLVTARLGGDGTVAIYNASGSVHLVADVFGWFDDGGLNDTGDRFVPNRMPVRVLDTRDGTGLGGVPASIPGGGSITFNPGDLCPTPGATAVSMNVTATAATAQTHFTVWPAGQPQPLASNLNVPPATNIPNAVIVAVSGTGQVSLYNNSGSADAVADLFGCFYGSGVPAQAGRFVPTDPARILDTRVGLGGHQGQLNGLAVLGVQVGGVAGVPSTGATAAVLNVTATNASTPHHLSVAPSGLSLTEVLQVAGTSVINYYPGQSTANMVLAPLGPNGQVIVGQTAGSVDVVIDVIGFVTA